MIEILIDDRERECIAIFDHLATVKTTVKRLEVGDFITTYQDTVKIIFERKTWDDLSASIIDGRIYAQVKNMKNYQCLIVIIVESKPYKANINLTQLQAKLDYLLLDGIHIIYTATPQDTVTRILDLSTKVSPIKSEIKAGEIKKIQSQKQDVIECFMAIPGISINTAQLFVDNKISLIGLFNMTEVSDFANLKYSSGNTIPQQRIKKIISSMGTKKCWIKILEAINGVTNKTASIILNQLSDINSWNKDNLAQLEKSETKKIGATVACRIINLISWIEVEEAKPLEQICDAQ